MLQSSMAMGDLMGTDCRLTDSMKYRMGQLWFSTSIHVSSRWQLLWDLDIEENLQIPAPTTQALAWSSSILCIQVSTQDCSLLPSVGRSFLSEGVSDEFLPALSIFQAIGGLHCTRNMWIDEVLCKEEALRRHTWNWLQGRTRILCRYFYDHVDILHWLSSRACLH
jgi:hypothetical protein